MFDPTLPLGIYGGMYMDIVGKLVPPLGLIWGMIRTTTTNHLNSVLIKANVLANSMGSTHPNRCDLERPLGQAFSKGHRVSPSLDLMPQLQITIDAQTRLM